MYLFLYPNTNILDNYKITGSPCSSIFHYLVHKKKTLKKTLPKCLILILLCRVAGTGIEPVTS